MLSWRRVSVFLIAYSLAPQAAMAEESKPVEINAAYTADVVYSSASDVGNQVYYLDNLQFFIDADLDRLVGWTGGSVHLEVLNNLGGKPNNRLGTLQGIDNIEVTNQRLRVFEAWYEQALGQSTTVRIGLYDLNSEFYTNDAAGGLIAPAFGVGSEIAATGPNGPSIFPSSALSLRINRTIGKTGYVRFAAVNANASTIGDVHGVDFSFANGALLIGEVGTEGRSKFSVGGWGYTRQQDDIRDVDVNGSPVRHGAYGAYAIAQVPLTGNAGDRQETHGFLRVGVSDGRTTAFKGGWQGGVMIKRVIASRPEGTLSIGVNQAFLSDPYRRNLADGGVDAAATESAIELTYADEIIPHVTLQPDFQWVFNPAGDKARNSLLVFGVRFSIAT